jgi:uncharacterized membrane protein
LRFVGGVACVTGRLESLVRGCSRLRFVAGVLAVALASSLAYLQTLEFGFIYDDYWTVVGNTHLDKSLGELLRASGSGRTVEWGMPDATRPLMSLSLWLDRRLFGLSPWGHHLQSVCLYAAVSVAVFCLAFALFRRYVAALVAGLAFALAPLHAEVVAAVNYREDLLATLGLYAAAALVFWPAPRASTLRSYTCAALFGVSLFAKESALAGPLILGGLMLVRRPPRWLARDNPPLALSALVVAVVWLNWRFGMSALGEQIPRADYPFAERLARAARFEVQSVMASLWPFGAQPEYDPLPPARALWVLGFLIILGATSLLVRRRETRFLGGAFVVALVAPVFSSPLLAPINEQADRYWFTGSLAFSLALGGWVQSAWRQGAPLASGRLWRVAPLVAALALFSVELPSALAAARVWSSEVELWTRGVQAAPASPRAWASLGRVHRMAGQLELAERSVERSLERRPDYLPAKVARVFNELSAGQLEEARALLRALEPETRLQRDAVKVAERCAGRADAAKAKDCVQRAVPKGLVLGDTERLRTFSEGLLGAQAETP